VPYRVDLCNANADTLDRLVELGAIDAELLQDGAIAALVPDSVEPERLARAIGLGEILDSPAACRAAGHTQPQRGECEHAGSGSDVEHMRHLRTHASAGWIALVLQASW
jgi:hypothetical protein